MFGSILLCNLRLLSKPWSLLADITTSKLSPSVRVDSTMKSCPSISVDISASSSGTPSATAVAVSGASCDSAGSLLLCPTTLVAFPSLSGQQASFSSVLVHDSTLLWLLQAVLQDLVQCSVVLATELRVQHSEPSTQSSAVATLVLHLPFLGPCRIARQSRQFKEFRVPQRHRDSHKLSSTRDFASRPPTSSTLVQTTTDELHSSRDSPTSSTLVQRTRNRQDTGFNSAPRPCLPCICSVSCAQLSFTLKPDNGLCNTHDECACESSLSMSRLVYRLKASAV